MTTTPTTDTTTDTTTVSDAASLLESGRRRVRLYTDGVRPMWAHAASAWASTLLREAVAAERDWTTALWRDRPEDDVTPGSPLTRRALASMAAAEDFLDDLAQHGPEQVVRNLLDPWEDAR